MWCAITIDQATKPNTTLVPKMISCCICSPPLLRRSGSSSFSSHSHDDISYLYLLFSRVLRNVRESPIPIQVKPRLPPRCQACLLQEPRIGEIGRASCRERGQ